MNDLINLIPSIILGAILTPLVVFPFAIAKSFITHSKQREDLANDFSEDTGHRYRSFLGNVLDGLDSMMGKPFSLKSFRFSLGIAFFYPVVINALMWLVGNYPYQLAGETIFPAMPTVNRFFIVIGVFLFVAIEFLLIKNDERINFWFKNLPLRRKFLTNTFFGVIILFVLVSIGFSIIVALAIAIVFAGVFAGVVAGVVTVLFAGAFASAVAFFFAGILAVAFTFSASGAIFFAFAVASTILVIFAILVAFAGSGAAAVDGTVAVVIAGAFTVTGTFAVAVTIVIAFAGTGVVALAITSAVALTKTLLDIRNDDVISFATASWLFFLLLLPFINALLDFVSTSFSRLFSRLLTEKRDNWLVVILWLLFDLVLAFWFLIGLTVALVFTLESLNQLLPSTETLFPWQSYVEQARSQPLGVGFFVVFMLYSTLIPTVLHIGLGLYSLLFSIQPFRKWLVNRLRQPYNEDYLPKHIYQETAVLSLSWVLSISTALILVPFGLYKLMQFRPTFNDGLYRLAYWAGDFAARIF